MPRETVHTSEPLPATRHGKTHKFSIASDGAGVYEFYLTANTYPDGRVAELFVKCSKEGSLMGGLMDSFCRGVSLAMHRGLVVSEFIHHYKDMRFEPMGSTSNPAIPTCESVVDYIARWLELLAEASAAESKAEQLAPHAKD
jgi:hypothetical protein